MLHFPENYVFREAYIKLTIQGLYHYLLLKQMNLSMTLLYDTKIKFELLIIGWDEQ